MKDKNKIIENMKKLIEFAYFEGHRSHVEIPEISVDSLWERSQSKRKLEEYEE